MKPAIALRGISHPKYIIWKIQRPTRNDVLETERHASHTFQASVRRSFRTRYLMCVASGPSAAQIFSTARDRRNDREASRRHRGTTSPVIPKLSADGTHAAQTAESR